MKHTRVAAGVLALSLVLGGCASTADYNIYAQGQAQIEAAKYAAEAAKYNAMAQIAASGTESSKIAAVMAMVMGGGNGGGQQSTQLRAPEAPGATALAWASVFVPALTQGYAIYSNTRLGMTQSNNNARVAESTNNTFLGMGRQIQGTAEAGTVAVTAVSNSGLQAITQLGQSSNTALTTLGQSSNTALATLGASSNTALTTLGQSSNSALATVSGNIQAPQPNISYTLSGTGVLGNGSYSTSSLGGNGVIGSGSYKTEANPITTTTTTSLSGGGVIGNGTNTTRIPTTTTTTTNNLPGVGTIGGGTFTPSTTTTTTTTTPPAGAASAPGG